MKIDDKTWKFVVEALEEAKKNNEIFLQFCRNIDVVDTVWSEAYWKNFDILVDSLGKLVNDSDDSWLCYYIYDCDWGNSPMEVRIDGEVIMMDSWDKLRYILEV